MKNSSNNKDRESLRQKYQAQLITFEKPNFEILAYMEDYEEYEFHLEHEDWTSWDYLEMSDDDIVSWALERELIEDENEEDIETLKSWKKEEEEENPENENTPSGRAYLYFEHWLYKFNVPESIEIAITEGYSPAHNGCGVEATNIKALKKFQAFMQKNDVLINFEIRIRH